MEYDRNGNIQKLKRKGHTQVDGNGLVTAFGIMDDLVYAYDNGNRLLGVSDGENAVYGFMDGNTIGNDYGYDSNGNMTSDANKGITDIGYNHLNLPVEITVDGNGNVGNIVYIYDATGTKLRKILTSTGESSLMTNDYAGNYIYENGQLQFFGHPEGYVTPDGNGGYDYVYQYRDHLGNVRLSYSDLDGNGSIDASTEILQERNYYPFGMVQKGYNSNIVGTENNYKTFAGKELNKELGLDWYDFGARNYDAALGRWMNVDPMAEEREWLSPYNFVQNNPINRIDPDGALDNPIYDTDGNFLGTDDKGLQGDAIVMHKANFKQGMAHNEAMANNLGSNTGLMSDDAKAKMNTHYVGLPSRPDYDGFVTRSEGIDWAKKHPNTLPGNITPDNSLYLDASKMNYGDLSTSNIGLGEGKKGNVNLFDYVNWFSSSSRSTTYALGNTQMKLLNSKSGSVKLYWDDYDWNYHNYPQSRRNSGQLPESKRDKLIYFERKRTGINDSHGFRVFIYGTGTIKTD